MKRQKPLVERTLHWCSKELIVQVTAPTRRNPRADWHCWLNITMAPGKRVHHERVRGVDSWQCVQNAMYFVQGTLEQKLPGAYAHEEGDGGFFPFTVLHEVPEPYYKRLATTSRVNVHG